MSQTNTISQLDHHMRTKEQDRKTKLSCPKVGIELSDGRSRFPPNPKILHPT